MTEPCAAIVDDDEVIRDALLFLAASRGLNARGYPSAEAFLSVFTPEMRGCVLTDIRMGGMSGLELFDQLKARGSVLPVIVLTGHGDVPMAVGALQRGVFDFVEKPFNDNSLIDKLFIAMARNADKAAAESERQSVMRRLARLSERERAVMALLLEGLMNKVIAGKLDVAMRTVEAHRASVFEKMEVRSAVSLANLLTRHDLPGSTTTVPQSLALKE